MTSWARDCTAEPRAAGKLKGLFKKMPPSAGLVPWPAGRREVEKMRRIATVSLVLLLSIFAGDHVFAGGAGPRADTSSGLVEGVAQDGVLVFRGIPYAEPPVGERRFRPSVMKERSEDLILAHDFGPACIQEDSAKVADVGVSEDCLTLNVWTPAVDSGNRPVMVWIYGGSNIEGSGSEARFNGAAFADRGDVVLVTFNYRVGLLGYLDTSEILENGSSDSVNNGLKDQMLALSWVRKNIAAFSGDPDNVTVFGESAGAAAIAGLLGTDHPEELFDRAIMQSRAKLTSYEDAKKIAGIYKEQAALMGIESSDDWMGMSEEKIFELIEKMKGHVGSLAWDRFHGPTYGQGLVIPVKPEERLRAGHAKDLEIIIGTTMDESRLWADYHPELCDQKPFDNELTQGDLLLGLGSFVLSKMIKMDLTGTDPNRKNFTDGQLMLAITDEIFFRIPSFEMADAHAQGGGKTYMYIFEYPINRPETCLHNSSPHATEIPFVFNNVMVDFNLGRIGPARDENDARARQELANTTQDAWVSFAESGDPNVTGSALGVWPVYEIDKRKTLVISANPRVVQNPFGFERKVIKTAGADKVDLFAE